MCHKIFKITHLYHLFKDICAKIAQFNIFSPRSILCQIIIQITWFTIATPNSILGIELWTWLEEVWPKYKLQFCFWKPNYQLVLNLVYFYLKMKENCTGIGQTVNILSRLKRLVRLINPYPGGPTDTLGPITLNQDQ